MPVFVDSPLAIRATEVFERNRELFDDEARKMLKDGDDPFSLPNLRYTLSAAESQAINEYKGPAIVVSASGMGRCAEPTAPGWSGIGCAEALAHLQGKLSLIECRRLWLHNTRAYAKRQLTWFRARPEALRLPPDDVQKVVATARDFWLAASRPM